MKRLFCFIAAVTLFISVFANNTGKTFKISWDGVAAKIIVDESDWPGVKRAASDLADDIGKVSGVKSEISFSRKGKGDIIVGTIGISYIIDKLIEKGKINVDSVKGKWESYLIDVVDGDLVIAGSDKRGTIYGIYDISGRIGVSPWYFMADVPVSQNQRIEYSGGRFIQPSPKVKYRGIFINDEWPSFGSWCNNRFGGINSKAYSHIFELLLRLKANYLWPAMWDSAFNEDDPECPRMADEYGIVMGTSHHEPMMRAHKEYTRRRDSIGPWDFSTNPERINEFFRYGMERNKDFDNIVTIGMRGDGDVAMGKGDDEANMATLRDVIQSQRSIISDIYGSEDAVPQLWAIFTEVQRYYDAGFTVPDDVTLLFCDNNWGYIRRTAPTEGKQRKGGYGMYYHIDMNGGPWNDRWVNTSPLPKLREQLNLAYKSGIDRIWIINVGDLKPKELPISFIMDYAWNPDLIKPGDEAIWLRDWSASTFGEELAEDVADVLAKYPKYNLWRKPEVQTSGLFSVENYNETQRIESLWKDLEEKCEVIKDKLNPEAKDAFFQLVYYPAMASAGVGRMYAAAEQNRYYASRGNPYANVFADRVRNLFERDSLLTNFYNDSISGGKWHGMMQDNHIGYTMWSMPERNVMPKVSYIEGGVFGESENLKPTLEYSIPAIRYDRKFPGIESEWIVLPDLGRGEGCMGIDNVTASSCEKITGPILEYDINVPTCDSIRFAIGILPTQDINPSRGLRIGFQMGDSYVKILDARRGLVDTFGEYTPENLSRSKKLKPLPNPGNLALSGCGRGMRNEIFDNIRWLDVTFPTGVEKNHTFKIIMIDPEVVVEQIVVNPDDSRYSYFGPPVR